MDGTVSKLALPSVLKYWNAVYTRKWVILAIIGACLLVALLVTFLSTPRYTASTRIEISRVEDKVTNVEGVEAKERGQSLEFYQTQYSLLEARSLAERTAKTLRLVENLEFLSEAGIDSVDVSQRDGAAAPVLVNAKMLDKVVDHLLNHIAVNPIRGSSLADISYTDPSPDLATKIANAWVDQFVQMSMDRRFDSTADARSYLETRLAELRRKLEESETDLVSYGNRKEIISLEQKGDAGQRTLTAVDLEALNDELAKARAVRIDIASKARHSAGTSDEALANSTINALREQRGRVAADYSKALSKFETGYPEVVALKAQLDALDRSVKSEEARVNSTIQGRLSAALAREKALSQQLATLKARYSAQQNDEIQFNILRREVDTNRQLYDSLLQRYKEIGVASVGTSNISIVDRAKMPDKP
ncbi:GumC family protein, partial [Blastomonas sp.]|uniref:GumC family protein n=1 Tax=Blastomonas sp. TaxID=1909299 RepID=UPI00406A9E07